MMVQGAGFRVRFSGFSSGAGFRVYGLGFRVWGLGVRVGGAKGFGFLSFFF